MPGPTGSTSDGSFAFPSPPWAPPAPPTDAQVAAFAPAWIHAVSVLFSAAVRRGVGGCGIGVWSSLIRAMTAWAMVREPSLAFFEKSAARRSDIGAPKLGGLPWHMPQLFLRIAATSHGMSE